MLLTGRGEANIRATHAKTLELSPDPHITTRATCVIALDTRAERSAPVPAGPVTITIASGAESFALDAHANSSWTPDGPAVIRRSPLALPGTLATDASAAAADLPRTLVEQLQSPDASVRVDVRARRGGDALVLLAADPAGRRDSRLAAELAVADVVLAEDDAARRAITALDTRIAVSRVGAALPPGRVLVVATTDLPGATLPATALDDRPVETPGLPARFAVAAATRARGPLTFAPPGADVRTALRATPVAHRLVVSVGHDALDTLFSAAAAARGAVAVITAQEHTNPRRTTTPPMLPSKDVVHCCIEPAPADDALEPAVRAAVTALLADGVPTRAAARALTELTGRSRRDAYDTVLRLGGTS